jgi:transcription antitermination factor NusG
MSMDGRKWYAVYTRSRGEKKALKNMTENGYDAYLPIIQTLRQWSDRKKKVEVPLISCYIFVHVTAREYYSILSTPGVVRYVTFEGKPTPIPDSQINIMKRAVEGNLPIEATTEKFTPGQMVKIISGPLNGLEGELLNLNKKHNLIIRLENIGYTLKVDVSASSVVIL